MRIAVVEDHARMAALVRTALERAHFTADVYASIAAARYWLPKHAYGALVLDRGLPDGDGLALVAGLRARGCGLPCLVLSARDAIHDRVVGLEHGADDYLPKPFAVDELLARLRALARRPPETLPTTLSFDDLELDTAARVAHRQGREIRLTAREFALLEYLMRNPNRVLDRARILEHVWDDNFDPVANAVDVLVGRVRRKVDPDGERPLIFTLRGMGYMLSARRPAGAA